MWRSDGSQVDERNKFITVVNFKSQYFPQCVKYLFPSLNIYWRHCLNLQNCYQNEECVLIKEGFISYACEFCKFNNDAILYSTPDDLEKFAKCIKQPLLAVLLKDRWFKGDHVRLKQILEMDNHDSMVNFITNCLWERGYENNYTLGQQYSIRMTTNLIQSGLDFKHHMVNDTISKKRGWNCEDFEKVLSSISTVADITKRYKCNQTYIMLELDKNNEKYVKSLLQSQFNVINNNLIDNIYLIKDARGSINVLRKLKQLIKYKLLNVLFVTDTEQYLNAHRIFYIYNSMKFYYYCLKNRFIFHHDDYETLYLIYTITLLEIINGGCLNSFTLEKSPLMHPLELNSRRCNALKRATFCNKTLCNDMDLKVDFIKGKRIATGSNDTSRIIEIGI